MDTTKALGILAIVVILGGGAFFLIQNNQPAMMTKEEGAMTDSKEDTLMVKESAQKEDGVMMEKPDDSALMEKKDGAAMMTKGSYEAYASEKIAKAKDGDVVLFFRASWCPTCRALDADIRAHSGSIPAGVTILDVDYDTAKDLKQKYGVTYQHTLVQVDANGNQIAKWSGSPTLAALLESVK